MACLVIVSGEQEGTYYQLAKRPLSGGRDPARDIQLLDPRVGRKHFLILLHDGKYIIRDTRSRNGVHVNEERIQADHVLRDGDEIRVGQTRLAYYDDDNPDRTNALQKYKKADRHLREDRTFNDG